MTQIYADGHTVELDGLLPIEARPRETGAGEMAKADGCSGITYNGPWPRDCNRPVWKDGMCRQHWNGSQRKKNNEAARDARRKQSHAHDEAQTAIAKSLSEALGISVTQERRPSRDWDAPYYTDDFVVTKSGLDELIEKLNRK